MMGRQASALFLGLAVSLLSLSACAPEPQPQPGPKPELKRIGIIKPPAFQLAQFDQLALGELAKPTLPLGPLHKGPKPMPGRLLVRVRSQDTSGRFTYTPLGNKGVRQIFPYLGAIPTTLKLRDAQEVEQLDDGSTLIRLQLEKATPAKQIRQLLKNTPFTLSKRTAITPSPTKGLETVVVKVRLDKLPLRDRRLGFRKYRELIQTSDLHKVFHGVGVRSVRRVFRMVEKPVGAGAYQIQPMKTLMQAAKTKYPLRASRGYDYVQLPDNMENWFLLKLDRKADLQQLAQDLTRRPEIETVLFDYPVSFHAPSGEPLYQQQWALHPHATAATPNDRGIHAEPAWAITAGNTTVTVAVIGSGIKEDLDELNGRIWQNTAEANGTADLDDDANGYIDDVSGITTDDDVIGTVVVTATHETEVASIIAAAVTNNLATGDLGNLITGVVGEADVRLMNISLGPTRGCAELAEAIQYATDNGADIINMSLGSGPHPLVAETIQNALSDYAGLIMVASSGNDNRRVAQDYGTVGELYPAWFDGVIAVGGTEDFTIGGAGNNGMRWVNVDIPASITRDNSTEGSNYGPGLDLVAPARNVAMATFSSSTQTAAEPGNMTGTSASAAIVSGVAALLIGKYPELTAAQVRSWLRATSVDLTDPEGSGANLVGDDIYSGAGLVSASQAVTDETPNPVVVDLFVERIGAGSMSYHLNAGIINAVPDDPDLGITVQGGSNVSWRLDYGVGDDPSTWIPITVPPALDGVVDVPRTDPWPARYIDVAATHNGESTGVPTNLLDTDGDGLQNRQVYTMRLTATDTDAAGQTYTYTDDDWFMPVRAMLIFPTKNTPVPVRWGWPQIDGIVDTRPGATYNLSVVPTSGGAPDWQLADQTPVLHQAPYIVNRGANFVHLAEQSSNYSTQYPDFGAEPSGEGSYSLQLRVTSPSGSTTTDTQEIDIDGSSFPMQAGWPASTSSGDHTNVPHRGIAVADMNDSGAYRIFVQQRKRFMSITPAGNIEWELPLDTSLHTGQSDAPAFLVEDLNGDDIKEIAVAGRGTNHKLVYLLNPDGTTYNSNGPFPPLWPARFPLSKAPLSKLAAGDINGDGVKEIIVHENPSSSDDEGYLHVLNLDGQNLPGYPVSIESGYMSQVPVVADIDHDGRDEIVLDSLRRIYEDNGQRKPNWPPANREVSTSFGGLQARQLVGDEELEIIEYGTASENFVRKYAVDVRFQNGVRLPGNWPVYLDSPDSRRDDYIVQKYQRNSIYVDTAQIVTGDTPEIVIAYDKIQVLDISGALVNDPIDLPEIVLDGEARGLKVIDVDGDGALEYVVLVLKFEDDDGWSMQAYGNLEAYELDGTRKTDNRWPIRVAYHPDMALGNTVAIDNINSDVSLEVINSLGYHPYRHWQLTSGLEPPLPWVIEVLDIPFEAEDATLESGCTVASNNSGFSGKGFVDYDGECAVEWTVNVATAGNYNLTFGYALAAGATVGDDRPLRIVVNGTVVRSALSFPATGATGDWNTWGEVATGAPLVAGDNVIRAESTGSSGPNLDYLN